MYGIDVIIHEFSVIIFRIDRIDYVGFDTQSHSRRILYAHIVFIVGDEVSEKLGPISINRYE